MLPVLKQRPAEALRRHAHLAKGRLDTTKLGDEFQKFILKVIRAVLIVFPIICRVPGV